MNPSVDERFAKGFRGNKDKAEEPGKAGEAGDGNEGGGVAIVIEPAGEGEKPEGEGDKPGDGSAAVGDAAADAGTAAKPLEGAAPYDKEATGPGRGAEGTGGEEGHGAEVNPDDGMPAMNHNEKTWQGRLNKREQELRDREMALQEREAKLTNGESAEPATAEAGERGDADALGDAATASVDLGSTDDILAGAPEDIQAIGRRLSDDLGPEFIGDLAKIMSYLAELKAGKVAADAIGPLREQASGMQASIDSLIGSFQSMHRGDIEDNEPEFESLINSPEFENWVMKQPDAERQRIVATLQGGSAGRIVKVLKAFKAALATTTPGAVVDTSALDAATGVHSTGTPQPATGTPSAGNPEDAFARGFSRARK